MLFMTLLEAMSLINLLGAYAWEGRLLVIGFTSGRIPSAPANLALLLKSCAIVGVFWGAFVERTPHLNLQNFDKLISMD